MTKLSEGFTPSDQRTTGNKTVSENVEYNRTVYRTTYFVFAKHTDFPFVFDVSLWIILPVVRWLDLKHLK